MKNLLKGSSRVFISCSRKSGHVWVRLSTGQTWVMRSMTFIHVVPPLALTAKTTILLKALKKIKISNTYFTSNVLGIQIVLKYRFNQTAVPAK